MFLRASNRKKNGKTHTYWSIVENRRLPGDRVVQRHVLYLSEINSSQEHAWRKSIDVFSVRTSRSTRPFHCSPRTARLRIWTSPSCESTWTKSHCIDADNLAPAGWPVFFITICASICASIGFGPNAYPPVAKARGGIWFCKPWWSTGSWLLEVSGSCIDTGSNPLPWPIC